MSINFRNQGRFINLLRIYNKLEITVLCIFLLCFCVFAIFVTRGYAQKGQENGRIWKSMSKDERHFYLGGLQEGTHELAIIGALLTGRLQPSDPSEKVMLKKLALSGSQRELLSELIDRHLKEIDLELFGTNAIADVMTNIYDDPANTFINFHNIAKIAVMKLKGKSDEDITGELQVLRRVAGELMSKP
jgi:hypothetical protein